MTSPTSTTDERGNIVGIPNVFRNAILYYIIIEGKNSWNLPAIKTRARTVAGRGGEEPAYLVTPYLGYV